ncbi:MAG TPA: tyrosine-type recombinase/integrase [Terriglobales bacterium]|nr:tyrosine-type recombinase/integrase [Terriglobales bacterium]
MITVRKAGNVYRGDTLIEGSRVRLSLGTRNEDAAQRLASRIDKARAEGADSVIWGELKPALPEYTFNRLAGAVGYKPPEPRPTENAPTWDDLRSVFDGYMQKRIAIGRLRESTQERYLQTIKQFDTFLSERGVKPLCQITKAVIESFKVWRVERIKAKKGSRGATGMVLDVAILHKVFQVAVEEEMIPKNPVAFEGRPGDSPSRGAQPFSAKQLSRLQENAAEDLLAFLLLRWTGLRGSDAVNLRWSEIHFDTREVERITQKRTKKVIVPIQSDLLAMLEMEHSRRNPEPDERVLLHPSMGTALTRKRLYVRLVALGKRAGVPDAHPHRYRDTFAVDMLARGASPYEVAKLLGDTIETIEKHYAEFVKELRERVRRMMESKDGGLKAFSLPEAKAATV